jgi:hypothetical protein
MSIQPHQFLLFLLFNVSYMLFIGLFDFLIGEFERIISIPSFLTFHMIYRLVLRLFHLLIESIETHTWICALCSFHIRYIFLINVGCLFERRNWDNWLNSVPFWLFISCPDCWFIYFIFLINCIKRDIRFPFFVIFLSVIYLQIVYSIALIGEIETRASTPSPSHFYIVFMSFVGLFYLSIDDIEIDASILPLSRFLYHKHVCWIA